MRGDEEVTSLETGQVIHGAVTLEYVPVESFADEVAAGIASGSRFAGLLGIPSSSVGKTISAVMAHPSGMYTLTSIECARGRSYPSLTGVVSTADWYEHKLAEQCHVFATGHHMVKDLFLTGWNTPRSARSATGEGLFTFYYGPVRSGIYESVGYELCTPGEDLPLLVVHPGYKHRGIERSMTGRKFDEAVRVAERVEGVGSVAHAITYCLAVESVASITIPPRAGLLRLVHAELERIADHVKVAVMLAEAAGLAVAYARFSYELELVQQLRGTLSGSRFSRGVVVPGGVAAPPRCSPEDAMKRAAYIRQLLYEDASEAMSTPSFIDRIRHAGVLDAEMACRQGAVGLLARGATPGTDVRSSGAMPLAEAYIQAGYRGERSATGGDGLARQQIRWEEVWDSFFMVDHALGLLSETGLDGSWREPLPPLSGLGFGVFESPQGECMYLVEIQDGILTGCNIRPASFHNLQIFPLIFNGDIFTDFAFNEASLEISPAGAAL
ncbi:MAG: nickel-dependent hydrogenase large subunit [Actinobacteria bacterium]|jgi:Ni,Fe-hydrogenase III large subunit|nr:nickel-dependent hydrogenase large subunit [Actinomycetota bacterium]